MERLRLNTARENKKTRVLVYDERKIRREGIACLLRNEADIEVLRAADVVSNNLILSMQETEPDVLVVLARYYLAAIDAVKSKKVLIKTRVVVLTTPRNVFFSQMIDNGVSGIVLETSNKMELLAAIRTAARGVLYIDPAVTNDEDWGEMEKLRRLSKRELDIFHLVAQGMENSAISGTIHTAEKTVKNHVSHILKKIEVENRTQLAVFAWQNGLARILPHDLFDMLRRKKRLSVKGSVSRD